MDTNVLLIVVATRVCHVPIEHNATPTLYGLCGQRPINFYLYLRAMLDGQESRVADFMVGDVLVCWLLFAVFQRMQY